MSLQKINWSSPIRSLIGKRKSKTIDKLESSGVVTLNDLLWIFPLKTLVLPPVSSFNTIAEHSYFKGIGKVLNFRHQPNFRGTGKGRAPLSNATITFQDRFSEATITCKWFNCYPSIISSLKELDYACFSGTVSTYLGAAQIISPEYIQISKEEFNLNLKEWISRNKNTEEVSVTYPTFQGISPTHLSGLFKKIPLDLWDSIIEVLPLSILEKRKLIPIGQAFKRLHGKSPKEELSSSAIEQARARLIYEEFLLEQIKIITRKDLRQKKKAIKLRDDIEWQHFRSLFPYDLTEDQASALDEVRNNLKSGTPMMRLIQGDVGSGKTTVSFIASALIIQEGYQASIMCPTESLALQHYLTAKEIFKDSMKIECLVGSLKKKEKDTIIKQLQQGEIDLVIGTHALFQESVSFKKLGLVTIDEQHKFGVAQRLKLVNKGSGVHCMLMTATPIPRSLSLTQYGDLEISTIRSMPSNRKGTKTRIVNSDTYTKYLSFLKTRVEMSEQAYVVVPAIEDNPAQDMLNLELVLKKYKEYFPMFCIEGLHGKMKAEDKNEAFMNFRDKKTDILISTSVIEVGINNPNATVMAILNPERFGLSSLHQMRGRVGRGEKPGFCFLVNDKPIAPSSQQRLKVIESNNDGFTIAEEDLKQRGEGDIFGKEQSGEKSTKLLASVIEHHDTLVSAKEDAEALKLEHTEIFKKIEANLASDDFLLKTI